MMKNKFGPIAFAAIFITGLLTFSTVKAQSVLDEVVQHNLQYYKDQLAVIQTHVPQTILDKLNTELINTEVSYLRAYLGEITAAGDKEFYEAEIAKYNNLIAQQTITTPEQKQNNQNASGNPHEISTNPDPNNPYGNIPAYVSSGNAQQDAQVVHEWLVLKGLVKE
jgi:hypothetical protein